MWYRKIGLLFLITLLLALVARNNLAANWSLHNSETEQVTQTLYGLNIVNLEIGAGWPTFKFWGWRNFHGQWPKVEPQPGNWDFKQLDEDIALAEQKGVETLLVLAMTPTWASSRPREKGCCMPLGSSAESKNIGLWERYVRTVAERYKGRVLYYELWNEPNIWKNFTGSVGALVELSATAYRVLKEVDPNIVVVSPSMAPGSGPIRGGVGYLKRYLNKGGRDYADVIGYHFYAGPKKPEAVLRQIIAVRELMDGNGLKDQELWNTEAGWNIKNQQPWSHGYETSYVLESKQAASYVVRSYLLNWAAGVKRFYWYAWGHMTMGLSEVDAKSPKQAAIAYSVLQDWLRGAMLSSCDETNSDVWECRLEWPTGEKAWVIWAASDSVDYHISPDWNIKSAETMLEVEKCAADHGSGVISLDYMPVLLRSKSKICNG